MNNTGSALLIITGILLFYSYGWEWTQLGLILFGTLTWNLSRGSDLQIKQIELENEKLRLEIDNLKINKRER